MARSSHQIRRAGDDNASGFAELVEPRRDINPVAEDIVAFDDHVAEMDSDAEANCLVRGIGIPVGHAVLHREAAFHGRHDRLELGQDSVTGRLDDPASVSGDGVVDKLGAVRLERSERAALVSSHQARIPDHVRGNDSGEAAGDWLGHVRSLAAWSGLR